MSEANKKLSEIKDCLINYNYGNNLNKLIPCSKIYFIQIPKKFKVLSTEFTANSSIKSNKLSVFVSSN